MEPLPKTRRETKKPAHEKKAVIYSQKHVRQLERIRQIRGAKTGL